MTTDNYDQALEARARELLAQQFDGGMWSAWTKHCRDGSPLDNFSAGAIRAIVAALREGAEWRELCRRLYVELFHCDQQMTSGKRPKWKTGSKVKQVLDDARAALAAMSDQNKGKV